MDSFVTLDRSFTGSLSETLEDYPGGIVIPVDKPYVWTSADVIRKLKFRAQKHFHLKKIKIGHAGTLDPLATGVLLVCVGKATKVAQQLQDHTKQYVATVRFGATTPSFDAEKPVDARFPYKHITREAVIEALKGLEGEIEQVPPIFSAKSIDGVRAYEIARDGVQAELKSSRVTVYSAELVDFSETSPELDNVVIKQHEGYPSVPERPMTDLPCATIRITCSKGTYIRSIARDLGLALGSGGYLIALRRTVSGQFDVTNSLDFEEICQLF